MASRIELQLSRANDPDKPFEFDFRPQHYIVRWGNEERRARFSWSEKLRTDLSRLESLNADGEALAGLSQTLRGFLQDAGWWDAHRSALEACRDRDGSIELVIRSRAAELYALPWELVQLDDGTPLGTLPRLLLRYEWPSTSERAVAPDPAPQTRGRTIFAWSAAGGQVPSAAHRAAQKEALKRAPEALESGFRELPNVHRGSLVAALEEAVRDGDHVASLHILCHGTAVGEGESRHFALAINDQDEGLATLDGPALALLLKPYLHLLHTVVLCACQGGGRGQVDSRLGSIAQELHRAGVPAVIASRLPLSIAGSEVLTRALYPSLLADAVSLEEAVLRARIALQRDPTLPELGGALDWVSLQLLAQPAVTPDLRPYTLEPWSPRAALDARNRGFLVGRGEVPRTGAHDGQRWWQENTECDLGRLGHRVLDALPNPGPSRLQVLIGNLGSGKSSLVRAGLGPVLTEVAEPAWTVLMAEPELAGDHRGPFGQWLDEADPLSRRVNESEAEARPILLQRLVQLSAEGPVLLVLDQAEELLTHLSRPQAAATLEALWTLAHDPELQVVVLLCVRSVARDSLGLLPLPGVGLPGGLSRHLHRPENLFELQPLPPPRLREVVSLPARRAGLAVDSSLIDAAVNDLSEVETSLPLLVYTLHQVWRQRTKDGRISLAAYHRLGGTSGALAVRADEVVGTSPDGTDSPRIQAARALFLALSGGSPDSAGNHRVFKDELTSPSNPHAVDSAALDRLVEELLTAGLVEDGRTMGPDGEPRIWLALGQPALLRTWPRLAEWRQQDLQAAAVVADVERAATSWADNGKDTSALARGDALASYRRVQLNHPARLSEQARAFIAQSTQAEARQKRRRGFALGTVMVVLVAASVVSTLAYCNAEQARKVAHDANLIAATESIVSSDPTLSLQLLQEVEAPEENPRYAALATENLLRPHSSAVFGPLDGVVTHLAMGPSSDWLVAGDDAGTVWVLPTTGDRPPIRLRRGDTGSCHADGTPTEVFGPIADLAVSPDGTWLAATWWDGEVCAEEVPRGPTPGGMLLSRCACHSSPEGAATSDEPEGDEVFEVAFSSSGSVLATVRGITRGAADARVHQATLQTWTPGNTLKADDTVALPAGRRLDELIDEDHGLWRDADDSTAFWGALDCEADCTPFALPELAASASLVTLALSPDGLHLASLADDGSLYHTDRDALPHLRGTVDGQAISLAIGPDSRSLLVGADDTSARYLPADQEKLPHRLVGHRSSVTVTGFTPDGAHLVTGSADRAVRVWPRPKQTEDRVITLPGTQPPWGVAAHAEGFVAPTEDHDGEDAPGGAALLWWPDLDTVPLRAEVRSLPEGAGVPQAFALLEDADYTGVGAAGPADKDLVVAFVGTSGGEVHIQTNPGHSLPGQDGAPKPTFAELLPDFGSVWSVNLCVPEDKDQGSDEAAGSVKVAVVSGAAGAGQLAVLDWDAAKGWSNPRRAATHAAFWDVKPMGTECQQVLTVDDRGELGMWQVSRIPLEGAADAAGADAAGTDDLAPTRISVHKQGLAAFGLAESRGCVVTAYIDGSLALHPLPGTTAPCNAELSPHASAIWNVNFDETGERIISASLDGTLLVQGVDAAAGAGLVRLSPNDGPQRDAVFFPGDLVALSVGEGQSVRTWDLHHRGDSLPELQTRVSEATTACILPGRREVILREDPEKAEAAWATCRSKRQGYPE